MENPRAISMIRILLCIDLYSDAKCKNWLHIIYILHFEG